MRFDVPIEGEWEQLNRACREALHLPEGTSVLAFHGLAHAIWEIGLGLVRGYPHKKSIAYWLDEWPIIEDLAAQMSSDGGTVRGVDSLQMLEPTDWLEPIKKDLLLLLESVDDPITGEGLASPALDAALRDTRIFRIRVSHVSHRAFPPAPAAPFEVRICSVDADLAIAIVGSRAKFETPMAKRMGWKTSGVMASPADITARLRPVDAAATAARLAAFAGALPAGATAIPKSPLWAAPSFDRILFAYADVDGLSVLDEAKLSTLPSPGTDGLVEAGSACRWTSPRALERFLKARDLDQRLARGLVALAPELANDETRRAMDGARARVLQVQTGQI
jgi:hypothetical protein